MIDSPWGQLPWWLVYTPVAVLGLALGSFANVLIYRLPRGESIVSPPSHCPQCGRQISALENIPLLSWLVLRARCRTCHAPISVRYPILEIAGAELAILAVRLYGLTYAGFAHGLLFVALLALVIIDLENWLLPFAITIPMTVIGLVGVVFFHMRPLADSLLGMIVGGAVLAGIGALGSALFRRKAPPQEEDGEDEQSDQDADRHLILPHIITIGILIILVVVAFTIRLEHFTNAWANLIWFALPFVFFWIVNSILFRPGQKPRAEAAVAFGRASEDIKEELKDAGAMGGGDIVFGMMAGVFLGWRLVLLMTFMASFLGTFLALLMVVMGINIKNLKIQFGPLLAVSAVFCLLVGGGILNWYVAFLTR
jgi:prepilin signal peptidase PulO-like enzyme (type II secretory pathway)